MNIQQLTNNLQEVNMSQQSQTVLGESEDLSQKSKYTLQTGRNETDPVKLQGMHIADIYLEIQSIRNDLLDADNRMGEIAMSLSYIKKIGEDLAAAATTKNWKLKLFSFAH